MVDEYGKFDRSPMRYNYVVIFKMLRILIFMDNNLRESGLPVEAPSKSDIYAVYVLIVTVAVSLSLLSLLSLGEAVSSRRWISEKTPRDRD